MIQSYDLGIKDKFDFSFSTERLPILPIIERHISTYNVSNFNPYYSSTLIFDDFVVEFPFQLTLKKELEDNGLKISHMEKEIVEDITSFIFEVEEPTKNLNDIEYAIIKKYDLNNKKVSITVY